MLGNGKEGEIATSTSSSSSKQTVVKKETPPEEVSDDTYEEEENIDDEEEIATEEDGLNKQEEEIVDDIEEKIADEENVEESYEVEPYSATMITTQDCKVRSTPDKDDEHNKLLELAKGTQVQVTGIVRKQSPWYQVSLPAGTEGYPDGCDGFISGVCLALPICALRR
mgnify:CR=1 FL=1